MTSKTSKSLFSEHYLERRLPQHPEWRDDAAQAFEKARTLYDAKKSVLANFNEAQTEEELIQPLLRDVLGFDKAYIVQPKAHQQGQLQRPDYALFANAASKVEADALLGNETAFYSRAVAIADAKQWERPLSQSAHYDNRNPSHQIVSYLVATGVDWGILSNGRLWRLYSRQVSGLATEFYEVDLVDILENRPQDFRRFWLFFRRRAFVPDAQGNNFLQRVRSGSATYARVVGDKLKDRVFDQIFPLLAGGFVANMVGKGQDVSDEDVRTLIYEATLSLLYKLLFLLYGEARNLLPVENKGYRRQSLTRIAQQVAQRLDNEEPLASHGTWLYNDLLTLFRLIDSGDHGIGLPRYNGGLFHFDFSDERERRRQRENYFLTQHTISDNRLARALDLLGRIDGEAVDYGYIGVRHLGAIYEGLLEYRLVVDDAQKGQVHLENDRGERKATGSYYTPDYIVKYIVRHTLEPILEERAARFGKLIADIVPKRQRLQELTTRLSNQQSNQPLNPSVESRFRNEQTLLEQELKTLELEARETLLDIKVCDPAMGSGHFLVEVVDYLTTGLITVLDEHPEHNPILSWLEVIRAEIMHNMAEQGIGVDAERLDDTQLLQRVIMKRCIYGVDLNRMAVELAKVSLWLHTFTIGAPLSFLDHHLRWGNSLVGGMAREAEEQMEPDGAQGQMALSFMSGPFAGLLRAAEIMRGISGLSDATLQEVERSEELFREFDRQARPYKRLLDVYAMRPFLDKELRQAANDFLLYEGQKAVEVVKAGADAADEADQRVLETARDCYQQHRFFHWDLEFPEVFIDLERADWKQNPGFDAVVGNPPYVRQESLVPYKPFFKENFDSYHGSADLYMYFFEKGVGLIQSDGRMAYISSGTFARTNFARAFRKWLPKNAQIESLVDFGENQPFPGAEMVRPSIIVLSKGKQHKDFPVLFIDGTTVPDSLDAAMAEYGFECAARSLETGEWTFQPREIADLFERIIVQGQPLGDLVGGQMHYGIKTGYNRAFYIDSKIRKKLLNADPGSAEIIKPMLRGADLRPWYQLEKGRWLIFTRRGTDIDKYPAVKAYLEQFRKQLEPRPENWSGQGRWPGRKSGPYRWFEMQDTVTYHSKFDAPKIVWADITKLPRFSWDDEQKYVNQKCYIIAEPEPYLLGILQSRVTWFVISQICTPLRLRAGLWQYQVLAQFVERLPIPDMTDDEKQIIGDLAMRITELAKARYQRHKQTRHRIRTDLAGKKKKKLGNKLTQWWNLDFPAFRAEIKSRFKRDIPLAERDEWETWLAGQRAEHEQLTAAIVQLETELNERVYALFDLTPEEIQIIEQSTKYEYGEV